jgi:N-formylglutamate amidohydrolase
MSSDAPSHEVLRPAAQTVPVVFASPHSGRDYTPEFLGQSALDLAALRRAEDAHVDAIFADAPALGVPLLRARFPRVLVDANRDPLELDPELIEGPLPSRALVRSPRVGAGLGVVPRLAARGGAIRRGRISLAEAEQRIARHHRPYHRALAALIEATRRRFGFAIVVDCHSMPSSSAAGSDLVVGDAHGRSAAPHMVEAVEAIWRAAGFVVARNVPYAGGYTTTHYGRPETQVHVIQLEFRRSLYMDEETLLAGPGLALLRARVPALVAALDGLHRLPTAAE